MLATVLGKAALITNNWTKYHIMAIPGSMLIWYVFIAVYGTVAPRLGISTEYDGVVPKLFGSPVFWLQTIVLATLCLIRDLAWKYVKRMYYPQTYHHIQEIQKYNIQDYRPRYDDHIRFLFFFKKKKKKSLRSPILLSSRLVSFLVFLVFSCCCPALEKPRAAELTWASPSPISRMEQFQKAIRKVRQVQRMRKQRGYAFSQADESQTRVINAYDTTRHRGRYGEMPMATAER